MVKPIKPSEVRKNVPDRVVAAFNDLISQHWTGTAAVIYQDDIANEIAKRMVVSRAEVFQQGWLNIEPLYEAAGWKVEYDKPGFNESYRATFTFSKRR